MTLICGPIPASINLGNITDTKWNLNGQDIKENGRFQIATSDRQSDLTIGNVILADAGLYECNLMSRVMTFVQNGRANINQAPNIRLAGQVNVKCSEEATQPIQCCVQSKYVVHWFQDNTQLSSDISTEGGSYCITHRQRITGCSASTTQSLRFVCRVETPSGFEKTLTMIIFTDDVLCNNNVYGSGRLGDLSTAACDAGQEGSRTARCSSTGLWRLQEDNCIVAQIKDLLVISEDLIEEDVPQFAANLSQVVQEEKEDISNSSATISAIVGLLSTVAHLSQEVNQDVMENVLETVEVIIGDDARESWEILRENVTRNASSQLLDSMEILSDRLVGEFLIRTESILLNRTSFNDSFLADFNSSVVIDISSTDLNNVSITTVVFSTLDNVLLPRNSSFNGTLAQTTETSVEFNDTINAEVMLVRVSAEIQNVTLSFQKLNNSLENNPQCVFWNFTFFDNLGAWDDEGCILISDVNNTVTCNCNHLTSFSILMATDIPESIRVALDVITYVGVGISLASLVICLIIEAYVWKAMTRNSTAFMRHVSIVNTALSLLIADICFIIAASFAKNPLENPGEDHQVPLEPCSTATFFMHFFYLALFFWMLVSGLLLFYRTVMVFSHMSKSVMLAIGFLLGYVCPLIIAVTTVAVTAPGKGYIRENDACWLNWVKTKALLALVIPALIIVVINILIVIVVLFKMLRRGVREANATDEKHTLVVIARCVIILTPLFGLTWSLGVGTMISPTNEGLHIAFAFFNSLQGFFILVFGTLWDSKIRAILSRKLPISGSGSSSNQTASTSRGVSSMAGLKWISRLQRRYIYHVSEVANSSSSSGSQSYSNT
nr:adhesion G protein-coupled receptor F5 [Nerophis lumbriciformis]